MMENQIHSAMSIQRRPLPGERSDSLDQDNLLARLYAARGIRSPEELDLSLGRLIPPIELAHLDAAARMLADLRTHQGRVLILGDYDADGATGTALMVLGLSALGFQQLDFLCPDRFRYGYGLSEAMLPLILAQKPDLLITVDNGISSLEGVAAVKAAGIQVIVTDHHLPGDELPQADVIVNPNLKDSAFPSKALAGVGVAFYLLLALRAHLRETGLITPDNEPNLADLTDLVALGTVADLVPLDQNNRILVAAGLKRIRAGRCRPGIQALFELANRQSVRCAASDLGFAIAPRLNAAGRLDDMSLGIRCLLAENLASARPLAAELDGLNRERRELEAQMQAEAEAILSTTWDKVSAETLSGISLFGDGWHQGVVGILASRVKERFHCPVIAFAPAEDETILKGSGRSIEGLHLRDTLDAIAARHPDLILRFGGHAMAAGLSIQRVNFDRFQQAFETEVAERLAGRSGQRIWLTDGALAGADLTLQRAEQIRYAGPWGQAFPEPLFDGRFRVLSQRRVGTKHLKLLLLETETGLEMDAIAFGQADQVGDGLSEIEAVYRLDANEYRGQTRLQLQLLHIQD